MLHSSGKPHTGGSMLKLKGTPTKIQLTFKSQISITAVNFEVPLIRFDLSCLDPAFCFVGKIERVTSAYLLHPLPMNQLDIVDLHEVSRTDTDLDNDNVWEIRIEIIEALWKHLCDCYTHFRVHQFCLCLHLNCWILRIRVLQ